MLGAGRRDDGELDALVDWDLMRATHWAKSDDEPDRRERRMAECLVHERVPAVAFTQIVVHSLTQARRAREVLATVGVRVSTVVRPGWYF
ncbi:DarT ssDNA thymidine ADP-ribosyltransferase family protein [Frankia canadensis]|uniref:DarT ssDNA thymidine ADP-ribosyltransferase family protein n=1 Tax=Frankia canadensis TaxID=1836972 RepID=UPI000E1E46F6|nr:DarT ssDNA thymidine ADP-ribosyltransferase family protein [Frankia canadensis]